MIQYIKNKININPLTSTLILLIVIIITSSFLLNKLFNKLITVLF